MNFITPTRPTWNGGNASAWKKDILAINGFDERMKYGGEDREFGERLVNKGIQPLKVRYLAIIIHLEHERGYVNDEAWKINNEIREETKKEKTTKTKFGLYQNI
jgi:GT2 family glycosyltransferase